MRGLWWSWSCYQCSRDRKYNTTLSFETGTTYCFTGICIFLVTCYVEIIGWSKSTLIISITKIKPLVRKKKNTFHVSVKLQAIFFLINKNLTIWTNFNCILVFALRCLCVCVSLWMTSSLFINIFISFYTIIICVSFLFLLYCDAIKTCVVHDILFLSKISFPLFFSL